MYKIISGIYQIKNKDNNKIYVGCSSNIFRRWADHKMRYASKTNKEYNKKLYQDMRLYGLSSFVFSIIEICDVDNLFIREKYYIDKLQTEVYGYNDNIKDDKHGKAKLSIDDVIDIRERYDAHETKRNVYYDYQNKIGERGFHKIWNGYTWTDIMMNVYTKENKEFHKNNTGSPLETNPKTKLKNEDVLNIREQKQNKIKPSVVYQEYKDKLTYRSFLNVWYGYNWKNIA